ncbi:hypothetical protein DOTSEDRAFT_37705 [Dothistroma septosporum NZE10]|uniref:Uncharacterized protein n=1 Tax=Dothistroma septosporum (strain NZE10 / CBS 128990) TaxID=675120 RepID=N1PED2_DOTSN|nr:hypothetical protein DOTSEDRAFT_37705 [Dothistroma septosporum NZE10]
MLSADADAVAIVPARSHVRSLSDNRNTRAHATRSKWSRVPLLAAEWRRRRQSGQRQTIRDGTARKMLRHDAHDDDMKFREVAARLSPCKLPRLWVHDEDRADNGIGCPFETSFIRDHIPQRLEDCLVGSSPSNDRIVDDNRRKSEIGASNSPQARRHHVHSSIQHMTYTRLYMNSRLEIDSRKPWIDLHTITHLPDADLTFIH